MKTGILSMQRVINNGSYLQAYALREAVRDMTGEQACFIDFENHLVEKQRQEERKNRFVQFLRDVKHWIVPKYWPYMKTKRYGAKFRKQWRKGLPELGLKEDLRLPDQTRYDLVVVGSDEVFNVCQFSDGGVAIPWELLADGVNANRLISYAAACGQTSDEGIREIGEEARYGELLRRFDAISVRDENTFRVVQELSGITPTYHIDPVLLAEDFPKDETYRKLPYRYLLIYAYTRRMSNEQEIAAIRAYAKKYGLKTVCVNCFQTWCDKLIVASPFALLQYVQDAERVITDTFHGTVFSIRCNVPFAVIVRPSNQNKLRFLLKQFSLEAREVTDLAALEQTLAQSIDFGKVNERLTAERERAMTYLREQIRLAEENSLES